MNQLKTGQGLALAEMEAALASACFGRTPRVCRLLRYLRDKCAAGESAQITEYNIAVDLLGRASTFVPSDDAIVRVEIHRLRKKLKEYYENEGAARPHRIVIPTGSYVPTLAVTGDEKQPHPIGVLATAGPSMAAAGLQAIAIGRVARDRNLAPGNFKLYVIGAAALAGLFALVLATRGERPNASSTVSAKVPSANSVPAASLASTSSGVLPGMNEGAAVRILAGRKTPYVDKSRQVWKADHYFDGGSEFARQGVYVARTRDTEIYLGGRSGNFGYDIPLAPGTYELRLHFAELDHGPSKQKGGGEGSRVFHVAVNRKRLLSEIDVFANAGMDTAEVQVIKDISPGPDGRLQLRFISHVDQAMVSAIEIVPAQPGRMNPVRMSGREEPTKDSKGNIWRPDSFRIGGRGTNHTAPVTGTNDPDLYIKEIYGVIDYAIPVAQNGTYDLLLHLAETYWGPENPGGGGIGSRVFDITCNGVALARNMDVFERVGSNSALVLRYSGLRPDSTGKLRVALRPVKNYAAIYGVEVYDTTN